MLTLANGDRILMTGQMKAFFEPENLNNASPATVSRAGIIYVSDSELGWQPIVASWLQGRKATEAVVFQPCFERYVDHMLDFIRCAVTCELFADYVGFLSNSSARITLLDSTYSM